MGIKASNRTSLLWRIAAIAALLAALAFGFLAPQATPVSAQVAGLTITQTDAPDPVQLNANTVYTVTIANTGAAPTGPLSFLATLNSIGQTRTPLSFTFSPGSCSRTTQTVSCSFPGGLNPGQSGTVTFNAKAVSIGTLTNTVDVNGVISVESTTVSGSFPLDLSLTAAPDPAVVNQNITYTMIITNPGAVPSPAVILGESLLGTGHFISAAPSQGACTWAATITCDLGILPPGGTATVVTIGRGTLPGTLTNTATALGNTTSVSSMVVPPTTMLVSQTASIDPIVAGQEEIFTISVTNQGATTASNVTVTDTLPAGSTFVLANPSQGTCTWAAQITCVLGSLGPGATATVQLKVIPNIPGTATNTAQVGDVISTLGVTVLPVLTLNVSQTVSPNPLVVGRPGTFTVTVTNPHAVPAMGAYVSDTIDATGVINPPVSTTAGTCTWALLVQCTLGTLAPGASAVVTINVTPTQVGTFLNTAVVPGNTSQLPVTVRALDTTPPLITPSISPVPNAAGWHKGPVTVTWTVADPESGVGPTGGCGPSTLSAETTVSGTTLTCSATNIDGYTSSQSATIRIDLTPPTIAFGPLSPGPNAAGWNRTNVTVPYTPNDGLSGVATVSPASPLSFTTEGASLTQAVTVTDVAGNSATFTSPVVRIDTLAPTLTFGAITPVPNAAGWNKTDASIPFATNDGLSGVATSAPSSPLSFTAEGAGLTQTVTVTDVAGNSAVFTSPAVKIDKTAPTLTWGAPSPAPPPSGWYTTNVSIPFATADGLSGVAGVSPASPLVLSGEGGAVTGTVTVTDAAGNSATFTSPSAPAIKIDKSAPVITFGAITPAPNAAGWSNTNVTLAFAVTDGTSGVATVSPASPLTFSSEGTGLTQTVTATDAAGNTRTATTAALNLKIDKTPPTAAIASPMNGATFPQGEIVIATYACADSRSGVASCAGTVPSGSPLDTALPGAKTFAVTVADAAGNITMVSVSYTVVGVIRPCDPDLMADPPPGYNVIRNERRNAHVKGTRGNDYIIARNGNVHVDGKGGDDIICTGPGNDKVHTKDGNDVIDAGGGNNHVKAKNGRNVIFTGAGNDHIKTGDGNDTISAGEGNNTVKAGNGNNLVNTGAGNDGVKTGSGSDIINVGGGHNHVKSGSGNDTITGSVDRNHDHDDDDDDDDEDEDDDCDDDD